MSFIEQATLKVVDQSSAQINKINAALRQLSATARSLRSMQVNLNIQDRGVQNAIRNIRNLNREMMRLRAASQGLNVGLSFGNIQQAASHARQLATSMQQAHTAAVQLSRVQTRTASTMATARAARARAPARGGGFDPHIGFGFLGGLTGIAGVTAAAIAHHIGAEARKGVVQSDISEMSLRMKQFDRVTTQGYDVPNVMFKPVEAAANKAIEEIAKEKRAKYGEEGGEFFNLAQRRQIYSEAFGITADVESTKDMTSRVEELARTNFLLGGSMEDATEGAYNYIKGLDAMGRMTFHTAEEVRAYNEANQLTGPNMKHIGDYSKDATQRSIEYLMKLQPEIGKEMTGGFFRQISKYLRGSKFAISDRGLGAVLLLGEDLGTTAAVGYNQAVKQISGRGITKQIRANQAQIGVGAGMSAASRDLLLHDLPKWLGEGIESADPKKRVESFASKAMRKWGLDTTTPEGAYEAAAKIAGDRTAIDSIAAFLYNYQELKKKLDMTDRRSGDPDEIRRLTADSPRIQAAQVENQFQSALGEMTKPLMKAAIPVTKFAQEAFSDIAAKAASPEGLGISDWAKGGMALGGLALSGMALAMKSGNVGTITQAAGGLGLTGAAAALTGAATALSGAALALGLAAGTKIPWPGGVPPPGQGGPGGTGGPGAKPPGTSVPKTGPSGQVLSEAEQLAAKEAEEAASKNFLRSVLPRFLGWGFTRLGPALAYPFLNPDEAGDDTIAGRRAANQKKLSFEEERLWRNTQALANLDSKIFPPGMVSPRERAALDRGNIAPTLQTKINNERVRLLEQIAAAQAEIEKLKQKVADPTKAVPPPPPPEDKTLDKTGKEPDPNAIEKAVKDGTEDGTKDAAEKIPPAEKWVPPEAAPPTAPPEAVPAATPWEEGAKEVGAQFANVFDGATTAAGEIKGAASELAASGGTAAGAMRAAAGGIGSAIGAAFAAVASSVHVNVSVPGTIEARATDKGTHTGNA